jgi:predicted transposase YdaD
VVIYPSRRTEQTDWHPYRSLLGSDQVHRVFLDELGTIDQLPLGLALMVLTTLEETQAPAAARHLLNRTQQEITEPETCRAIIEMLTTIMIYKFTQLSRAEVEAMMEVRLEETRFYQDVKQEEAIKLILRQLTRRLRQELAEETRLRVGALPLPQLEDLGEALLDFSTIDDLNYWLAAQLGLNQS